MIGNERLAACVAEAFPTKPNRGNKLSDLDAQTIIGAIRRGHTHTQLAKIYGVNQSTIGRAVTRHNRAAAVSGRGVAYTGGGIAA
jgi:hypothetical protein